MSRRREALDLDGLRVVSRLAAVFRRGSREVGMGVYLMLAEIAARGEVSSARLDKVMARAGYKNARQYRHEAQVMRPRLIVCREDADGKWWSVTPAGREVLGRLVRRIGGAPAKLGRSARGKSKGGGGDGQMMLGLFDGEV